MQKNKKKTKKLCWNGSGNSEQRIKKVNGIMISGGICKKGLGRIIFHGGNVNPFTYRQFLNFYKVDIDKFANNIVVRWSKGSFIKNL